MNFIQSVKLYFEIFINFTNDYEYNNKKLNLTETELSLKKKNETI